MYMFKAATVNLMLSDGLICQFLFELLKIFHYNMK